MYPRARALKRWSVHEKACYVGGLEKPSNRLTPLVPQNVCVRRIGRTESEY